MQRKVTKELIGHTDRKEKRERLTTDQIKSKKDFSCTSSQSFWFIVIAVFTLKILLIPAYHSTDFEVHRNWMAITNNLSVQQWYYDNTSQWTLDYPPLFAYFEYFLSKVASYIVPEALVLQPDPFFSEKFLYFHRFTVIVSDVLFVFACSFVVNTVAKVVPIRNAEGLGLALISCVPLLIVDNIHFQYNSFLFSILLFSIGYLLKRRFLMASFWYCVLLNFKHIYLYYAPAYAVVILTEYLAVWDPLTFVRNGIKLATVIIVPFVGSFGLLIYQGGEALFWQIVGRLFPFHRGLTHAYWAPNIWACYNFIDFCLYKVLKYMGKLSHNVIPPAYTSGLVQEYAHSILPDITPKVTLICTGVLLLPMTLMLSKKFMSKNAAVILLTHSSFAFFLAGYHVHEKAIIMILVPFTVLAFCDSRYTVLLRDLCLTSTVSLFPLLFTPFENLIKIGLALTWYFFLDIIFQNVTSVSSSSKSWALHGCFVFMTIVQLYAMVVHPIIFGSLYAFVPLMLTSTSTALWVVFTFFQFLYITYISS